jgi:hypothetical protein
MIAARAGRRKLLASAARLRYLGRVARIAAAAFMLCLLGCEGPPASIALEDLDGHRVELLPVTGPGASVFVFVATDCPISNRSAPDIDRLRERFTRAGMRLWIVYPGGRSSLEELRRHRADFFKNCAALRDPQRRLAEAARIDRVPEAAVFTSSGGLVYHGRIDDRFADVHLQRPSPTRRDLEAALEAVARGNAPLPAAGASVGCPLPE